MKKRQPRPRSQQKKAKRLLTTKWPDLPPPEPTGMDWRDEALEQLFSVKQPELFAEFHHLCETTGPFHPSFKRLCDLQKQIEAATTEAEIQHWLREQLSSRTDLSERDRAEIAALLAK